MYLFINAISEEGIIILFDKNFVYKDKENMSILGQESMTFIDIIDNFMSKNNVKYEEINNIIFVNGPGSFTGVRTITLVINTLAFIFGNIKITPVSYFDLFKNYPIIKKSSKRDLFVKKTNIDKIEVVQNQDFLEYINLNKIYSLYGENFQDLKVIGFIDYINIINSVKLESNKTIDPLYIKKPSIS